MRLFQVLVELIQDLAVPLAERALHLALDRMDCVQVTLERMSICEDLVRTEIALQEALPSVESHVVAQLLGTGKGLVTFRALLHKRNRGVKKWTIWGWMSNRRIIFMELKSQNHFCGIQTTAKYVKGCKSKESYD